VARGGCCCSLLEQSATAKSCEIRCPRRIAQTC
jgi:hypothetical protein